MRAPGSLLVVLLLGVGAALAFAFNWSSNSYRPIIRADPEGYYAYLPAWFADGDPSLRTVARQHYANDDTLMADYGLRHTAAGGVVDKYGAGVAIAETPLFLTGHLLAQATGGATDGFSQQEQALSALSGVIAGVIGLFALRALLLRRFRPGPVTGTLACVCLGTSLFNYMGYDSGFSHAFSFAALALILLSALRWIERPGSWLRAAAVGGCAGYLVLLRPTNAVLVAAAALMGVATCRDILGRARSLRRWWRQAGLAGACAVASFIPQVVAWHAESGAWLISPYPASERLDPLHPHVGAIISVSPHGLIPYAPVLLLVPVGLLIMWRRRDPWLWGVVAGIAAQSVVIAGWHDWWYGAGFGQRGFVDVMALFAIPMAALFHSANSAVRRVLVAAPAMALTGITVLLGVAYWQGRMPLDGVSPGSYLRTLVG